MTGDVYVVETSMTPFGRHHNQSVVDLCRAAVEGLLESCDSRPTDIDAAFFANTTWSPLEGQHMAGGPIALRELGIEGVPVFNVENACASGATALHLAVNYVRAGQSEVALAIGVEKMNVGDKLKTMAIFDGAYDVSRPELLEQTLAEPGAGSPNGTRSVFMDIYAALARRHMREFGTTQEQIAAVAAKNHGHAALNDRAFYRRALTIDEVLHDRALAYPLTVSMCAPLTDGSASVLVASAAGITRLRADADVRILASSVATGSDRAAGDWDRHITSRAAARAYREAGVGPEEISVAEVHDATAFAEILISERLGLCVPGRGGADAAAGRTSLGGDLPINPSGGLESKGHPLGATGLAQVHELVDQLRGRAGARQVGRPRIALAENGGGFHRGEEAVAAVTILARS